jgi:hypothetical protein
LYFRQILGRILRTTRAIDQQAWIFTFTEPKLAEFAHRIELELPDSHVVIRGTKPSKSMGFTAPTYERKPNRIPNQSRCLALDIGDIW